MDFIHKLERIIKKNNSLICVGLDSDFEKIPSFLKKKKNPQFEFNKGIIEATYDLVCAYKLNTAFYEAEGLKGLLDLKMTFDYLRKYHPKIPVILDGKRGDIGSSNKGYVKFAFDFLGADAITLHPYLGQEALQPFLERKDKGCIILCRTSNPGAGEFQDLKVNNNQQFLYQVVAQQVVKEWNKNKNCLLVVGATYPKELKKVRKIAGDMILLIPGIGAQGGDVEKTVRAGLNSQKAGMVINSSRGIIFASGGCDFAEKAREEALKIRNLVNYYRLSSISAL